MTHVSSLLQTCPWRRKGQFGLPISLKRTFWVRLFSSRFVFFPRWLGVDPYFHLFSWSCELSHKRHGSMNDSPGSRGRWNRTGSSPCFHPGIHLGYLFLTAICKVKPLQVNRELAGMQLLPYFPCRLPSFLLLLLFLQRTQKSLNSLVGF